jgi:hypothetical protein
MEGRLMDGKQTLVQRAREFFADRLDDVAAMVRQDRQEMRGWEEPAHLRAVVRRTIAEGSPTATATEEVTVAVAEREFARGAGEPDRGQQREAIGQLLEAGASALEKMTRSMAPDINAEELLGLECVLLMYGRPALLVSEDRLSRVPPFWNILEDQREDIEMTQRGVGRIELFGHPDYDWAGTGFLVNENTLMTTRRIAEVFAENRGERWEFRPGITAWMGYRSQPQGVPSAGYRVRSVVGVHDQYDVAFLEVEPPQLSANAPTPLALAAQPPQRVEGRCVYLVGFPVRDSRRNEPEGVARIFRDVYGVKRVLPGTLRSVISFRDVQILQHDCSGLGQTAGACLVDLETHQVLGMQVAGRYLETASAIPLWVLRDDPLCRQAGVTFAQATTRDLENTTNQLERLARSRYWAETQQAIGNLYQRAFGNQQPRIG